MNTEHPVKVGILDDYQNVALDLADWSTLDQRTTITVFNDHVASFDSLIDRLEPFEILCVMRERTPLPREILEKLPNLKLIVSTGSGNASIDESSAAALGIAVRHTGYSSTPTIEFTWALILSMARNIPQENRSLRDGGWQMSVGEDLEGRTLGLLGLGRIGSAVGKIAKAFNMKTIAWSQNLTHEAAEKHGIQRVSKEALFSHSDYLSIHTRLSPRTYHIVGKPELAMMKSTSRLINTSRGPVIDGEALVHALKSGQIAGAAIDVFDVEPLETGHPLRHLTNVLATPHIGYVSKNLYRTFYEDTVRNIVQWLSARDSALPD